MRTRSLVLASLFVYFVIVPLGAPGPLRQFPSSVAADTIPSKLRLLAAFTYNPCVMCAVPGDFVFFNANTSTPLGLISTFAWNFGDGTPVVKTNNSAVGHDYFGFPNKWLVTLTVYDSLGRSDSVSQLVMFEVLPTFTVQPKTPIGRSFLFNATGSRDYNLTNPITGYFWTFGDGTNGTGIVVKHAYQFPGIFRVTLSLLTPSGNPQASKTVPALLFHGSFGGLDVAATGSFATNSTTGIFTGYVTVDIANATTGQTLYSKTFNITTSFSPDPQAKVLLVTPAGVEQIGLGCFDAGTSNQLFILSKNADLANQGRVNIIDVATIALSYGSTSNSRNWNGNADLDGDGSVSIQDVAIAALEYGMPSF